MKPLKTALVALVLAGLVGEPAQAAWNNVFQPTCNCRTQTSRYVAPPTAVAYAAPVVATPACNTCAQKQCSTSYTQRCFYQPVTSYESRSYYEPVTTMQTSYYYEPVTTYSYSCYYDPCTCSTKQVATPVTSYSLKAQSCPVQSWVQRCAQVPVTTYQKSCYLEPHTTCCTTTTGPLIPTSGSAAVVAPPPAPSYQQAPSAPQPLPSGPPVIDQQRAPPPGPSVGSTSYYPTVERPSQNMLQQGTGWQPSNAPAYNRISQSPSDNVQGQVTRNDQTPRARAELYFVNSSTGARQTVVTNDSGRFTAPLTPGSYYVYLASSDRGAAYHSQLQVLPNQTNFVTLVNQ